MWQALKVAFNLPLPNVAITCGWPSRRSRGRGANRVPGEILLEEWKGSQAEKAFVSIHPERFNSVEQVALSVLYVVGNEMFGSRRNLGANTLGVVKNDDGVLTYAADDKGKHAKTTLTGIAKNLGAIPAGFAELPEPNVAQRTRLRKYACNVCGQIARASTDDLQAIHATDNGTFVLQVPTAQAEEAVVPAATPKPPAPATAMTPAQENRANLVEAIRSGAARVVHGRAFGAEAGA